MTEHVFVGAGDGPCAIVMVGTRVWKEREEEIIYPVNELAAKYGASVLETTPSPDEAYSRFTRRDPSPYREGDLPTSTDGRRGKARTAAGRPRRGRPGWFVLNARDARWWQRQGLGRWADLEGTATSSSWACASP